jgi:HAE1 family hydrophobic/amphiphilic exporter-1
MKVIDLSVNRPIGTMMVYIGVLILGVISLSKLAMDLLPNLSYPKITVFTDYPGSGPEEIERFITTVLEGPLAAVPGVKDINSVSKEGISIITLEFHWGTDMNFALLHTKEQVEGVRQNLPDDSNAPMIVEWDPSSSAIMTVVMKSDKRTLKRQKEMAEYIIKPRLEELEGISRVEIRGGDEEEISVEIDPGKIKDLGITLTDIARSVQDDNVLPGGGTVEKDQSSFNLKIEGALKSPREIEKITVQTIGGREVHIKDIGRVFFKNKTRQGNIRFNTGSSIALLLYKESGGNTVEATEKALQTFERLSKEFNREIEFQPVAMESELIISSIDSLNSSLVLGAILAIFVLLLFLQNYKDPLLISIVIPICIISTFVLMYAFNVSMNIMSLGGLVLGVGMFVDNSVIVMEVIARYKKKYKGDKAIIATAAIEGTNEVGAAITGSTLTNIAIFLPVIYLYGVTGRLFRDMALTVSFSLLSSLAVALTLLPALASYQLAYSSDSIIIDLLKPKPGVKKKLKGIGHAVGLLLNPLYKKFNRFYDTATAYYQKLLGKLLDNKRRAIYITFLMLVFLVSGFILLKKEILPIPESRKFEIMANTIPAYGFEQTDMIGAEIEQQLLQTPGVDYVFTETGAVSAFRAASEEISVNSIHFIVACRVPGDRRRVMRQAREILKKADLVDYSLLLEKNTISQYLFPEGENFQLKVFYEDIEEGKEAVTLILDRIKDLEGLRDLKTNASEGKPLFAVQFKQDVLDKFDISRDLVAIYINQAVRGDQAGLLRGARKNYDIFVRVPLEGEMPVEHLLSLPISIHQTTFFLRDLVDIRRHPSIKKICRESQERYFLISGNARDVRLDQLINKAEQRLSGLQLPAAARYIFSGEEEERQRAFSSINQAALLAILLVYLIMAAEFENLIQPLMIMLAVPMGITGAFWMLLATGSSLNIISGIGILVLIGMSVNIAIVLMEYANQLRDSGMGIREAVLTAARVRMRPILMTTITTVVGVVPMALMTSAGSDLERPLALVVLGGLTSLMFLTLFLIPVLYEAHENHREKRRQKRG